MSETVNYTVLVAMAEQDAQDKFDGHAVINPFALGTMKRTVWQQAYDKKLAELRGEK